MKKCDAIRFSADAKRSFESLGQDEDLIWQAYQNGELIDEEMLGVYPEKVNRL